MVAVELILGCFGAVSVGRVEGDGDRLIADIKVLE
jgi:hypothetical protein